MSNSIFKAHPDIHRMMETLIANHHPHLALISDEIVVLFKEKASKQNDRPVYGKTRKAPAQLQAMTDNKYNYKFVIELAHDVWQTLTDEQRIALLDHHLCAIHVDEDAESGEIKTSVKAPDFIGFKGEFERHGLWRPLEQELLDALEKGITDAVKPIDPVIRSE